MENKLAINTASAHASNTLDFKLLGKLSKIFPCRYYVGLGSSSDSPHSPHQVIARYCWVIEIATYTKYQVLCHFPCSWYQELKQTLVNGNNQPLKRQLI